MHLQIAWRNIWRNPKRTSVILLAVIIGAWTMILFGALSRGMMESILINSLNTLTGHIQIQKPEYRDDPVVENRIHDPQPLQALLENDLPPDTQWAFRIEVGGIASNARNSKAISIIGIETDKEPELSFYGENIIAGKELSQEDSHGIVIGKALADRFETKLGRKIVLMTQGVDKETSSRAFRIKGIYRAELEETEKRYVFITLPAAQKLIGEADAVTNVCIKLPERDDIGAVAARIGDKLSADLSVRPWYDMLPLLKGYLGLFESFMFLWYLVVFVAMAFGLVNTMLMAVLERVREFGLLKALGMKPVWIVRGVLTEGFLLLLLGLAVGNLLGFCSVYLLSGGIDLAFLAKGSEYFGMGTLIVPQITGQDVTYINAVILVLGLIVCLYPAIKAGRVTPVEAMT